MTDRDVAQLAGVVRFCKQAGLDCADAEALAQILAMPAKEAAHVLTTMILTDRENQVKAAGAFLMKRAGVVDYDDAGNPRFETPEEQSWWDQLSPEEQRARTDTDNFDMNSGVNVWDAQDAIAQTFAPPTTTPESAIAAAGEAPPPENAASMETDPSQGFDPTLGAGSIDAPIPEDAASMETDPSQGLDPTLGAGSVRAGIDPDAPKPLSVKVDPLPGSSTRDHKGNIIRTSGGVQGDEFRGAVNQQGSLYTEEDRKIADRLAKDPAFRLEHRRKQLAAKGLDPAMAENMEAIEQNKQQLDFFKEYMSGQNMRYRAGDDPYGSATSAFGKQFAKTRANKRKIMEDVYGRRGGAGHYFRRGGLRTGGYAPKAESGRQGRGSLAGRGTQFPKTAPPPTTTAGAAGAAGAAGGKKKIDFTPRPGSVDATVNNPRSFESLKKRLGPGAEISGGSIDALQKTRDLQDLTSDASLAESGSGYQKPRTIQGPNGPVMVNATVTTDAEGNQRVGTMSGYAGERPKTQTLPTTRTPPPPDPTVTRTVANTGASSTSTQYGSADMPVSEASNLARIPSRESILNMYSKEPTVASATTPPDNSVQAPTKTPPPVQAQQDDDIASRALSGTGLQPKAAIDYLIKSAIGIKRPFEPSMAPVGTAGGAAPLAESTTGAPPQGEQGAVPPTPHKSDPAYWTRGSQIARDTRARAAGEAGTPSTAPAPEDAVNLARERLSNIGQSDWDTHMQKWREWDANRQAEAERIRSPEYQNRMKDYFRNKREQENKARMDAAYEARFGGDANKGAPDHTQPIVMDSRVQGTGMGEAIKRYNAGNLGVIDFSREELMDPNYSLYGEMAPVSPELAEERRTRDYAALGEAGDEYFAGRAKELQGLESGLDETGRAAYEGAGLEGDSARRSWLEGRQRAMDVAKETGVGSKTYGIPSEWEQGDEAKARAERDARIAARGGVLDPITGKRTPRPVIPPGAMSSAKATTETPIGRGVGTPSTETYEPGSMAAARSRSVSAPPDAEWQKYGPKSEVANWSPQIDEFGRVVGKRPTVLKQERDAAAAAEERRLPINRAMPKDLRVGSGAYHAEKDRRWEETKKRLDAQVSDIKDTAANVTQLQSRPGYRNRRYWGY